MFIEISTWIHLFRVGKMDYSATRSLNFSLFLWHSCYVPMGAIIPGAFSNGLNINKYISHLTDTGLWGRENLGNGSQAEHDIDHPRDHTPWEWELCWAHFLGLLVPGWDVSPGGLRCVGEPQSWTHDISEQPPATQVQGVHMHPEPQPVLQVRKDLLQK